MSADSRGSNGTDLYGYVTDNPLRYTDPTGNALTDTGPGGGCGGDLACAEIAAWNAFHPGECWGGCPLWPAAPATPAEVDPGLALLAASGLTSPEKVQAARRARDLQACAADPQACAALGGSHGDPMASSTAAGSDGCGIFSLCEAKHVGSDIGGALKQAGTDYIRLQKWEATAPIKLTQKVWNAPGVQCAWQVGSVVTPWVAAGGGTLVIIVSGGSTAPVVVYVTAWGYGTVAGQAFFTNGGPTFDKC
ncbi:MAG: hypothetical protein KGK07_05585 [Chloroflexota bacterium]|nr:hypothetical protein [Chloroflexota bacterium]